MLIIKMASMLESIAIDVYSFPTSKLAVNAALFAVVIIVTYTVFSWLVKALILAAKQEWTYRDVCAEPAPSLVHGHVPYVCALPTCGILCLFVFVVISYEGTSLVRVSMVILVSIFCAEIVLKPFVCPLIYTYPCSVFVHVLAA